MANQTKPELSEELRIIPAWAIVLAAASFVGMLALFFHLMTREPNPPPLAFQALLGVLTGGVIAVLVLLIGYVNQDAKRRNMNRVLWTLLVIFVPNALGFILYFLLRRPLPAVCPNCSAVILADAHYCSRCGYQVAQTCPNCRHGVGPGDTFCPNCGQALRPAPSSSPSAG